MQSYEAWGGGGGYVRCGKLTWLIVLHCNKKGGWESWVEVRDRQFHVVPAGKSEIITLETLSVKLENVLFRQCKLPWRILN